MNAVKAFLFLLLFAGFAVAEPVGIVTPALVNLYPSAHVIYVSEGIEKPFQIIIQSRSDSSMVVSVEVPAELQPFFVPGIEQPTSLPAKGSVTWKWNVSVPEGTSLGDGIEGNLVVDLEQGQERVDVFVRLVPQQSFLDYEIGGYSLPFVVVVLMILVIVYKLLARK